MIVFLFAIFLIVILLFVILILSNIQLEIDNIIIQNTKQAYQIFNIILKEKDEKLKLDFLDFMIIEIKIKIKILNIIPIFKISLNENKLKKLLIKLYEKEIKKQRDIEKDKKKAKKLLKKVLKTITLEKTNLTMQIGTDDAALTALTTSSLNSIISITLPFLADIEKIQNYKFQVQPIYLNTNVFFLQLNCIITSKIVHIIKVICEKKEEKIKK